MGAFGVGVFESDVRGDVEELLEEGGKPAVVKAETVPAVSPKASSSKLSPIGRGRKDKCGSPQIVEGLRLRGVRDGRRGGLLVIDR